MSFDVRDLWWPMRRTNPPFERDGVSHGSVRSDRVSDAARHVVALSEIEGYAILVRVVLKLLRRQRSH